MGCGARRPIPDDQTSDSHRRERYVVRRPCPELDGGAHATRGDALTFAFETAVPIIRAPKPYLLHAELLELGVFRTGLREDRDVRVCVVPHVEEILVGRFRLNQIS